MGCDFRIYKLLRISSFVCRKMRPEATEELTDQSWDEVLQTKTAGKTMEVATMPNKNWF